jgi:serine/threonine protein kinase
MHLGKLQVADLAGKSVKIVSGIETKCFQCIKRAGEGTTQNRVVWKALDSNENPCAIKFVTREEYPKNSLSAEMKRTRRLGSRFAQITAYGDIRAPDDELKFLENEVYAIVVEWVEGRTFQEFCSQQGTRLNVPMFLQIAAELCETLVLLNQEGLCHNDLHERNIMVVEQRIGPHLAPEAHLKIIDTGSLMTVEQRKSLLEKWSEDLILIQNAKSETADQGRLKAWIDWFTHEEDQEWVVFHLVTLLNLLRRNESALRGNELRFLAEVTPLLLRIDHTRRMDHPADMYQEMEMLWKRLSAAGSDEAIRLHFGGIDSQR